MKTFIYTVSCLLSLISVSSHASVLTVKGRDVGNNVVFNVSGSFDTTGLPTQTSGGTSTTGVSGGANPNTVGTNDPTLRFGIISFAETVTSPTFSSVDSYYDVNAILPSFGTVDSFRFADFFSGDAFVISLDQGINNGVPYNEPGIRVPDGYVSLTSISAEMIFLNQTLAIMGFNEGFYSFNFGDNVINIDLTNAATVPLPAAFPLFIAGISGMVVASRRRRKSDK